MDNATNLLSTTWFLDGQAVTRFRIASALGDVFHDFTNGRKTSFIGIQLGADVGFDHIGTAVGGGIGDTVDAVVARRASEFGVHFARDGTFRHSIGQVLAECARRNENLAALRMQDTGGLLAGFFGGHDAFLTITTAHLITRIVALACTAAQFVRPESVIAGRGAYGGVAQRTRHGIF